MAEIFFYIYLCFMDGFERVIFIVKPILLNSGLQSTFELIDGISIILGHYFKSSLFVK